jgi:hypothetical protein
MDELEQKSLYSLHILSHQPATKTNLTSHSIINGALKINGGIASYGNIITNKSILATDIDISNNLKIGNNLYISGNINFGGDIIPPNNLSNCIGKKSKQWKNIYTDKINTNQIKTSIIDALKIQTANLDVINDISLGTNVNNEPLFQISTAYPNTCLINGNLSILNNVIVNGNLMSGTVKITHYLQILPQRVDITNTINELDISSSLILLTLKTSCDNLKLIIPFPEIFDDVVVKIVIIDNNDINTVVLETPNNNTYKLKKRNDYIELLVNKDTCDVIGCIF